MAALALAGACACDSTQQQAARARLRNARFLASETPTIARGPNASVRVLGVSVLRGTSGTALAVRLRNETSHPLNDLPISVGIIKDGRRTYLNAGASTFYFQNHLASIAGEGALTWVFTTPRRVPAAVSAFATVGARASMPPTRVRTLPRIAVKVARSHQGLQVSVTNDSAVPQYQLQVYALGLAGGRDVAAGRATIGSLGTGSTQTLPLQLIGARPETSLQLEALPTMFR
jgi:hypothetical protein